MVAGLALAGCGNKSQPEGTPQTEAQKDTSSANGAPQPKAPSGKSNGPNPAGASPADFVFDDSTSEEDRACQAALASVTDAKQETYCKNNSGVKTCQWLYQAPNGQILYDQRANADADKGSKVRPLSCAKALKQFIQPAV